MSNKRKKSKKKEILQRPSKQQKLFNNLLKTATQFIEGRSFLPLTASEFMARLRLPDLHKEMFNEMLASLVEEGILELSKGHYSSKKRSENLVTGTLKLHPRGFGFVKPADATLDTQDIFIPKHLTHHAVDGDQVEVLINKDSFSEKGPEGRIVAIISRGRTHLAGTVTEVQRNGTVYAYAPLLGTSQRVIIETTKDQPLVVGDRVAMKVVEWGNKESATIAELSHRIGHISDPSCDILAAIEEYELRSDFSLRTVAEAEELGCRVSREAISSREDLRNLTTFTIDPDTAKDFDDAISLTKDSKGHYHLGVHIADVSYYVRPGTALDDEAKLRCNSTYFPGVCIPMLPKQLADNLCSLKANVNRLTVSVLMEFDPDGTMLDYRITRSVIKSSKRFTYKEAKAVLEGKKRSIHSDTLKLMVEMCRLLKKKRYERGSIEFAMPELVVLVDNQGVPTKTDYVVYDITHQLVEEFMLKANETVAWHLSKEGKNLTYRIHDEPSEDNLKDFSILAGAFGFSLSEKPTPRELQNLFDEAMQTPYGEYLATSYIRRMRLAMYSPENIGHYGLSLTHYCHFTSPIRRYVDLVVHRILFHEEESLEALTAISEKCSEQERMSSKAENSVVLLKKLRMLETQKKIEPMRQYEAVITKVKNFGIYFEVLELMLESYLHVSQLEDDYYVFDEDRITLRGNRTGKSYHAGDRITVMLNSVDLVMQESRWSLISGPEKEEDKIPYRPVGPDTKNKRRPSKFRPESSRSKKLGLKIAPKHGKSRKKDKSKKRK